MKRWCSLVLAMLMLFCSMDMTKASTSILFNGWELKYPTDEFGDTNYDQWYLACNEPALIIDQYGNMVGGGVVSFVVTETFSAFELFEVKDLTMFDVTQKYSSYTLSIKDSSGNKHKYTCNHKDGLVYISSAMSIADAITSPDKYKLNAELHKSFIDIFAAGGDVEVVIKPTNSSGDTYKCTVADNSTFLAAYPIEEVKPFYEGMAAVNSYKYGMCNTRGQIVVPCEWDDIDVFQDGLCAVKRDEKWGFIDKTGKLVLPCEWDYAGGFSEGLARVVKNSQIGYIDKTGTLVIPCIWEGGWDFVEGLAPVKKNGKWGWIDKSGTVVIPCESENRNNYEIYFMNGIARVKKNGKSGWIDRNGNLVISCIWDDAWDFSEGLARVKKNGKVGYIDRTGTLAIPCEWDTGDSFNEGLAAVQKNGKWGFVDKNGTLVISCVWDSAGTFKDGIACVYKNKKYGLIDKNGNLVSPCQWESVWTGVAGSGVVNVKKNGKWGVIDTKGTSVIPCEWSELNFFDESGVTTGHFNGVWYVLDTKGKKAPIRTATGSNSLYDGALVTLAPASTPMSQPDVTWDCTCGSHNTSKFCGECGSKRPDSIPTSMPTPRISVTPKPTPTATTEPTYKPLKQGGKGDDVLTMKKRLQELGYFSAGAEFSNQYNKTTTERVKLFQKANGLKQTGVADEDTLALLYSDKAKRNPY